MKFKNVWVYESFIHIEAHKQNWVVLSNIPLDSKTEGAEVSPTEFEALRLDVPLLTAVKLEHLIASQEIQSPTLAFNKKTNANLSRAKL